jgi:ubiquitin-protein ligase E3 A
MMSLLEGSVPNPYFKMRLSRNNLLAETLSLIELQEQENPAILRKQLFIEFENEQGIDQGGVSKEFFQLVIDELLNKGYSKDLLIFGIFKFIFSFSLKKKLNFALLSCVSLN